MQAAAIASPTQVPSVTGPAHIGYLDGWRGVAILLLMIGHFTPVPGINLGTVAVNFFFVLSGYLMAGLLFTKRTPLPVFYRRRIARIVPAHLVFITAMSLFAVWQGDAISWRELVAAALFVNNYVMPDAGPGTAVMPFGHVWSLSVEEHAYLGLSVLALLNRNTRLSARACLAGAVVLSAGFTLAYFAWQPPKLAFTYWLHSETAAWGLLLAALLSQSPQRAARGGVAAWLPLGLVLLGVMLFWWSVPMAAQRLLGVSCFALALTLLAGSAPLLQTVLSSAPLRLLGTWSFSLYLWQQPFYLWARDGRMHTGLALALALACGLLSFYAIERPARDYLNAHWGKRTAPTSPSLRAS